MLAAPKKARDVFECNACTEISESGQSHWRLDTWTNEACNSGTVKFRDEYTCVEIETWMTVSQRLITIDSGAGESRAPSKSYVFLFCHE